MIRLGTMMLTISEKKIKKKENLSTSIVTGDAIKRAKSTNPKLNAITVENFDIANEFKNPFFRIFSRRTNFY